MTEERDPDYPPVKPEEDLMIILTYKGITTKKYITKEQIYFLNWVTLAKTVFNSMLSEMVKAINKNESQLP